MYLHTVGEYVGYICVKRGLCIIDDCHTMAIQYLNVINHHTKLRSKNGHQGKKCKMFTPAPTSSDTPAMYRDQRCKEGVLINNYGSRRERDLAALEMARELAIQSAQQCCKFARYYYLSWRFV